MRLIRFFIFAALLSLPSLASAYKYDYQTVKGDPMNTLVYTLPNGLKVYMSVNKEQPRIQTNIAVRVGSKNDPAETTGLAHYFEHMMFKGSKDFGTSDYAAESPMLDEIESLFETYRVTTDSLERVNLYHLIDSISYQASLLAIPNEYDKLMSAIGAVGTNAYTSYDKTCYVEDIPSNEIERWAKIQSNRFEFPVLRGFHTELETIYEEKNMSLTRDSRKMTEAMFGALFPDHPYGQWSVLGHQMHLKNPSLTNIKNYHKEWYVPNNMAILMAGDFDPDNVVDIVTKYFGHLQPNPQLPKLDLKDSQPITSPIRRDVWGNEAESLMIAWAFPGVADESIETLEILDAMLNNGKAGLIDIDINKKQLAQSVGAGVYGLTDHSAYYIMGRPKQGQTLEEVEALIFAELKKLRDGDFDEALIPATINNYKLGEQKSIESNSGRVNIMESIFINDLDPERVVTALDRQSKLTKKDIVDFANKYLRDDNFVAIYKRQGPDTAQLKIAKQPITPIAINRDKTSRFLEEITSETVAPIEPVFLDFDKDLEIVKLANGVECLYKQNVDNDLFVLTYYYDFGTNHDLDVSMLGSYFPLLGTPTMTNEEIAQKFYEIACSYSLSIGTRKSRVSISGLSENMPAAVALVEDILANAVPDADTYARVAQRNIKTRNDLKKNQQGNLVALRQYMTWGPEQLKARTFSDEQILNMSPKSLTDKLAALNSYEHEVVYYGPMSVSEVTAVLNDLHKMPAELKNVGPGEEVVLAQPEETIFFIAPYDSKQLYMAEYSNNGQLYDPSIENLRKVYNEYFGGSMNSIVFQEMREARSLAYSAGASMYSPAYKDKSYQYLASIATQNDKMEEAINAFEDIIENMPESDSAFNLAKTGLDSRLRSERVIKDNVAWTLISNRNLGIDGDSRQSLFEALPSITLEDVADFQEQNVKGRKYYIGILGDPEDIDIDALRARGKVVMLTTDEIFGY